MTSIMMQQVRIENYAEEYDCRNKELHFNGITSVERISMNNKLIIYA